MQGRDILIYLSSKYEGSWDEMIKAIKMKEPVDEEKVKQAVEAVKAQTLTIVDKNYPEAWRHSVRPPLVIYYYGDISLLDDEKKNVSYVGSREASEYGLKSCHEIVKALVAKGFTIVSGLAMGIDSMAGQTAVEEGGKSIGVLGSGIDLCYPSRSLELYERLKKDGLVISEYPGMTKPVPGHFPERNRIVASSSQHLIVGEAGYHSGTLITVGFALNEGKDVACLPYPAFSESSCNALIRDGASLIDNLHDLYEFMGVKDEKA